MKNTIKLIFALFFLTVVNFNQSFAQSKQSCFNLNLNFEGTIDLNISDNLEVNIYNGLMKELLKDDLIQSKKSFSFEFEKGQITVDGQRLKGRNYHKYRDIMEEDMNDPKLFKMVWTDGKLKKFQIKTS